MRRPVPVRRLEQVHHLPLRTHREPFLGHRGAGNIAAQPLAQIALVRLAAHARVQGKSMGLRPRRDAVGRRAADELPHRAATAPCAPAPDPPARRSAARGARAPRAPTFNMVGACFFRRISFFSPSVQASAHLQNVFAEGFLVDFEENVVGLRRDIGNRMTYSGTLTSSGGFFGFCLNPVREPGKHGRSAACITGHRLGRASLRECWCVL